jgi:hypothetical protein
MNNFDMLSLFVMGVCNGLAIIAFTICIVLLSKVEKLEKKCEELRDKETMDWYNLLMKIGHNSNEIQVHEDFLQMKFPDMNKTILEKYSKPNKKD